jgi:Zn-dependent protease with chaperone function
VLRHRGEIRGLVKFIPKIPRKTADASTGTRDWPNFIKAWGSVALSLVFIYIGLGFTADMVSLFIPERYEVRLFAWSKPEKITDAPVPPRAQKVFDRLIAQPGLRPLPYSLHIINSRKAGATSYPGGATTITEGLLVQVRSDAGLAMVLGHELGHHHYRDSMRSLGRTMLLQVMKSILFGEGSNTSAAEAVLKTAEARFSRKQEQRADLFGLRMAHRAYGHQATELEFFERYLQAAEGDEPEWASMMSSHPYIGDRIAYLKQIEESASIGPRPDPQ